MMNWIQKILLSFFRRNGRQIAKTIDETVEKVDSTKKAVDELREKARDAIGQRSEGGKPEDDQENGDKIRPRS